MALTQARAGVGQCISVEGPAGIGKTALLDLVKTMAYDGGFRVLDASGGELEIDLPFGVVRQLFGPVVIDRADWRSLFAGPASMARPVLSAADYPESLHSSGGSGLFESLNGLFWLTSNLAESVPLLLAIDDAHWCDGASLRYLIYVQRRLEGLPLAMVVASRPGEPSGHPDLLDQLGIQGRAMVLHPSGLSEPAVGVLLHAALFEVPDPDFTAAAHAATGGNPFLVQELAIALIDRELRPTSQTAAQLSMIGPDGVQRSILRRLSALGPGATALARAAAVLGHGCELRHAARLSGLDTGRATELVNSLVRVQILRDEPQLGFVHPLVRAAVYADMTAASRAQAHGEAAVILSSEGADMDAVAAHLLESPALGNADVVDLLRGAARRAASHGAMDVASSYLRRALAEPPRGNQYADVLRELGTAELAAGQPNAAAERLAAAAAEANDFDSRLSIVLMRRHALVLADRIAEAVSVVDAIGSSPDGRGYADLLEAAAIGAGQLDFAVAPTLEHRLIALRDRAKNFAITEPLACAVAASANALANGDLELTQALTERAVDLLTRGASTERLHGRRPDRRGALLGRAVRPARRAFKSVAGRRSAARFVTTVYFNGNLARPRGIPCRGACRCRVRCPRRPGGCTLLWPSVLVARRRRRASQSARRTWPLRRSRTAAGRNSGPGRDMANHRPSVGQRCSCWLGVGCGWPGGCSRGSLTCLPAEICTNRIPIARRRSGLGAPGQRLRWTPSESTGERLNWPPQNWRWHASSERSEHSVLRSGCDWASHWRRGWIGRAGRRRWSLCRGHRRDSSTLAPLRPGALRRTGQRTEARARLRGEDLASRCGAELLARAAAHDELVAAWAHPRRARLSGPDSRHQVSFASRGLPPKVEATQRSHTSCS